MHRPSFVTGAVGQEALGTEVISSHVHVALEAPLGGLDTNPVIAGLTSSHLAYIIYTSGSAGKPKGVMVEHQHVARLFEATQDWFHFDERDVWCLFHSFSFDFTVWELWGALRSGGRLVIVPRDIARPPQAFHRLVVDSGVTVLNQTPACENQYPIRRRILLLPVLLRLIVEEPRVFFPGLWFIV